MHPTGMVCVWDHVSFLMVNSMLGVYPTVGRLDGSLAIEQPDCEVTMVLIDLIYNEMICWSYEPSLGAAPLCPSLSPHPVTLRELVWVTVVGEGSGVDRRCGCMGP